MKTQRLIHSFFWLLIFSFCISSFPASPRTVSGTFQDDKESLHGVLLKTQLEPPLRDEVKHIRFSPNGKYVVAQDKAGISVLSREPFKMLFHLKASGVSRASFTFDSQDIAFYDGRYRVHVCAISLGRCAE